MKRLEIQNISKAFGKKVALQDVSFIFPAEQTTCVMGPSGCGKTTLLRILAGLEAPDSGNLISDYKNPSFVFQEDRLCEDFTPLSNIKFVCGKKLPDEKIKECLRALGLTEHFEKPVKTMSGGMKRRVALARALLASHDILLMDEPFKGLDAELKRAVLEYWKTATAGETVICVTHDKEEAAFLGNHILQLKK